MGEFELIQHYFKQAPCAVATNAISLGIGDDCALLIPSPLTELAISTDTLIADVHFPALGDPFLIGQRALAVAVSDLAAMGAKSIGFTLALTLSTVDELWLKAFSEGLSLKAQQCSISLIGGDTTKGPLTIITITVIGEVPYGKALRRSGANSGDLLCVSGYLGEGAGALPMVLGEKLPETILLDRYWSPIPQLALGVALRDKATACLDVSDGLVADCGHIAKASNVALVIDLTKLPCSPSLLANYNEALCRQFMLTGGDDYQLAFTLPSKYLSELTQQFPNVQVIGRAEQGAGISVLDEQGQLVTLAQTGYQHF